MAEGGSEENESTDEIGSQEVKNCKIVNNDALLLTNNNNFIKVPTIENCLGASSEETIISSSSEDERGNSSKSSSLPHGAKLFLEQKENGSENGLDDDENSSIIEDKWTKLQKELKKAHEELQAKDDEVEMLKGIRQQVEDELHDLTSSLFVEAHKMVQEAKMKEISSEKNLRETRMQLEGLQAEVGALKTLLITSTPSRPNLGRNNSPQSNGISTLFKKQHKRTPSHHHLLYGRATQDETDSKAIWSESGAEVGPENCELDPEFHSLYAEWRQDPSLSKTKSRFLLKIYNEDIDPCLEFKNSSLVTRLLKAVEENSIWVEPLSEKEKTNVFKECALLQVPRICNYRMSFAYDSDEWFEISQIARDRIAATCEFLNYMRYIKNGLVKASVDDTYWEIIRLRKQMALAKLGIL